MALDLQHKDSTTDSKLSERDWRDRISYAERQAYQRGYAAGRADASVWNAELWQAEEAERHWRQSWAGYSYARRDPSIVGAAKRRRAALWAKLDAGREVLPTDRLTFDEWLTLYLAEHPGVSFTADPGIQPYGRRS